MVRINIYFILFSLDFLILGNVCLENLHLKGDALVSLF